jgi:hypothetical protein
MTTTTITAQIQAATTTTELNAIVEALGVARNDETYAETADRLRNEGDDRTADLFDAAEARWFELGA